MYKCIYFTISNKKHMTTLFAILAQFIMNPTFEKVEYTQKDRQTIGAMVKKS
jgi:hypothetical protein